ncbi:MAG: exopolysaccharide Pel transporter PelG, partial [Rickettsiales bacterium]|nr:exopolysaccharide Pel transporter PelG [Rickettsiales bacterium]
MAGIGFVLKRMIRRDDLVGVGNAYLHSSLISCGPWVFTIIALGIVYTLGGGDAFSQGYLNLQASLFYNFAFSLIFTAPLHMVATRYIADCIYKQDITDISYSLLHCLAMVTITQILPVAWFYFHYLDLPLGFKLAAFVNFFLLSFIWLLNVYLTALKNYMATTRAFAIGMFLVFIFSFWLLRNYNETGILVGFDLGLAWVVFSLLGEVLAEYNYRFFKPELFWNYFVRYWELALAGMFYSIGVWGD